MILFVTRKYPPSVGGMQRLAERLVGGVSQHLPVRLVRWSGERGSLPIALPYLVGESLRVLLTGEIRLVHIGDAVLAPLGILLHSLGHVPIVINTHGLDVTYANSLYQAVVPRLLQRFDRVISISHYTSHECICRGVSPQRCVVIPPGIGIEDHCTLSESERTVWLSRWGVDASGPVLLSVGRLVRRKGIAPFVSNALPALATRLRDWTFLVIGDGPERDTIEAAIEEHGLSRNVRLLGRLDEPSVKAAYALADVFVMPNIPVPGDPEGFGLVVLEARAAGLPVVAANLQGIGEAQGGCEDGTLVTPLDWDTFVDAIADWVSHRPSIADRQRRRARVLAEFGWDRIAERYVEVYREVLREHR